MTRASFALSISLTVAVAAAIGCGKSALAPGGTTDQVAAGAALFAANCAKCHGAAGQGTSKAPPLVGSGALPLDPRPTAKFRKTQFRTAKDVLDFIRVNMPADNPGSLSEANYEAILAFALKANGVDLHGVQVNEATASSFVLH
jgi:mono/diheme cytochrome c family protein